MADCTLVTCGIVPDLDPDDRLLMRELMRRGFDIRIEAWNDPRADWSASSLCVLRSTWDYHRHCNDFIAWIDRASAQTEIQNAPGLLKWNVDKSYLRALQNVGVPTVPTEWVGRGERCDLAELREHRGWSDVVVKPSKGVAGHGVSRVRPNLSEAAAQAHLERLAQSNDVLVQPYFESIVAYGERSLMFFENRYSHAIVKKPFDTVLAIRDEPSSLVEATPQEIAVASQALAALPERTLYARVDLLRDGDAVYVSELELIEPSLYLAVHAPASVALADAIEKRLDLSTEAVA